jgi:hypothetical protein
MPCPLYVAGTDCRCTAVREPIVPSLHERERFCRSGHRLCPTYVAHELTGGPIPEENYYRLWLSPRRNELHTPDAEMCI